MESDTRPWWRDTRHVAAAVWIFGCAAYYYVRFTWSFLGQYGDAIGNVIAK